MNTYKLYDVKVTLLTPLHIGSGRELLHEYDYAIEKGSTWRINEDALLDAQDVDDPGIAAQLARTPPARLLDPGDFRRDTPFFRYVIRGTPRSTGEGAQLVEQLKDSQDQPYLPGTSLKGALRTALAWVAWGEREMQPQRSQLGRNPRFAAQRIERELFGRDPNHDLLRALHVTDSAPVDSDRLMVINARVLHRNARAAAPIELEALRPDTVLRLSLKIDEALFSNWAQRRGLHMRGADWLRRLPAVVRAHTEQRLGEEASWFSGVGDAEKVAGFYRQLQQVGLPDRAFLIQLGWGTGWNDKTLGSRLREDPDFMEGILRSRREGGYGIARGNRRPGDPFPRSRRVVMEVRRTRDGRVYERPASPMGWMLVELVGLEVGPELETAPPPRQEARTPPPREEPRAPAPPISQPERPEDLEPGQVLEGTVLNIVGFGAFVDVGVGHDGLVHISELAEGYVTNVEEIVRVGQRVRVKVLNVEQRGSDWRIGLTMKGVPQP